MIQLQSAPAEITSLMMLLITGVGCLLFFRTLGLFGLYSFISISVLAANIQVLTAVRFSFFSEPVVMGTVVFAGTYMASNIITEHYGQEAARKGIWIGFASMLFMTILMVLTMGWPKLELAGEHIRFDQAREAIETLFMPAPAIFVASFIAYIASQYNDIWIFHMVRKLTAGRMLWLRTNLATVISAFVDTVIFSFFAWWVFAPDPLSLSTIWYTYILGTYIIRIGLSFINTPFVYLSYSFKPPKEFVTTYG